MCCPSYLKVIQWKGNKNKEMIMRITMYVLIHCDQPEFASATAFKVK